jgi:NhaP-type Na+/H+ or K+/H+ antiporter
MHDTIPLTIAFILMVGMLAQWASWRLKQPSILLLLLIGIIAGPATGLIHPDDIFGDLLFPAISLGVALVLFEGALTLKFSDLRGHGKSVFSLVTWGALLNWLVISAGTWLLLDLSWSLCLLFGALVVVTGPTVIMPLLRSVKPSNNISNILRWEGILIDPLGALLAVLIFEVIIAGGSDNFWLFLGKELASGTLSGILGGVFLAQLLRRHLLPEYLQNVFTLALVLTVFTLSNLIAEESGLLAVTVMGIWLANSKGINMEEILSFKESLSLLIISTLFIVLAARIDLGLIMGLGWIAAGIIAVVLIARVVMVTASTFGADLKWQEKALLCWIAPRGIVAAAVSALFAFRLEDLGYKDAALLPAMTFLVIIVTVLVQSLTSARLARWLKVQAVTDGILIVGGTPAAIAIARGLKDNGFRVKVASGNWSEAQAARMAGVESYFGSPVSAHAEIHLDLLGFGQLFAMSRRPALNTLSAVKYQREFGKDGVFTLRTAEEKDSSEKSRMTESLRVPRLFGKDVSIQKISSLISQGYTVKTTRLTEEFSISDFDQHYGDVLKLFAIDAKGKLRAYTDSASPNPEKGWRILFLYPDKEKLEKKEMEYGMSGS